MADCSSSFRGVDYVVIVKKYGILLYGALVIRAITLRASVLSRAEIFQTIHDELT